MANRRACRGRHEILVAREFTPMGVVVDCLRCADTFHASEAVLASHYFHAHHSSPEGPEFDRDFFLLETLVES